MCACVCVYRLLPDRCPLLLLRKADENLTACDLAEGRIFLPSDAPAQKPGRDTAAEKAQMCAILQLRDSHMRLGQYAA